MTQGKRKFGDEKRATIDEEVGKLYDGGFITETQYSTWLANIVFVRKVANNWHMCVDFIDLNMAFPKDPYPLSDIDRLIDGSSSYRMLSFMNAYSRYNYIIMGSLNAPKTTFMLNPDNYDYYNGIPFGLKNIGATYE